MRCACGWEGPLAQLEYRDGEWLTTLAPMCLACRHEARRALRNQDFETRLVRCES